MSYQFSATELAALGDLATDEDWSGFYTAVYNITASEDEYGEVADPYVREWFRVAAQANAGLDTSAANLIRDYTAAQIYIRTGQQVTEQVMDAASDAIAVSVAGDILADGKLPTLEDIREYDAGEAITTFVSYGYDVDESVWSGNVLMSGLGLVEPLNTNILNAEYGGYDLVVAVQSISAAGIVTLSFAGIDSYFSGEVDLGNVGQAIGLADDFLYQLYGGFGGRWLSLLNAVTGGFQAGRDMPEPYSDTLTGDSGTDFIHSGDGDDYLVGTAGLDLLDGGDGDDVADFSSYLLGFYFQASEQSSVGSEDYCGFVIGTEGVFSSAVSTLYNIETLVFGGGEDTIIIDAAIGLDCIDAGDGTDAVSLLAAAQGGDIDLAEGTLVCGSNNIELLNVEDVMGSSYADAVVGSDAANVLSGQGGNDEMYGGAGADTLHGDEGNDTLYGGSGADLLIGGAGDDFLFSGDDIAGDTLDGGDGDDVLYGNGSSFLTGGAGADVYHMLEGDTVLGLKIEDRVFYEGAELTPYLYDGVLENPVLTSSEDGGVYYWMQGTVA